MSDRARNTLIGITAFACLAAHSSEASQPPGPPDPDGTVTINISGVYLDTGAVVDGYIDLGPCTSDGITTECPCSGELFESGIPDVPWRQWVMKILEWL